MTLALTPGGNAPLPAAQTITIQLAARAGHADLIALLLDGAGRADGDNGVVLFSQPQSAGGAVSLDLASDTVTITLGSLPSGVERVLVVAQADGTPDVTACGALTATVSADGGVVAMAAFEPLPAVATLQLVELYLRGGAWKVRSLGDGYADGLAKLLTVHGVDVTDDGAGSAAGEASAPAASSAASAAPAPTSPPMPAAPPAEAAPASPTLNMRKAEGKVDLRKGQGPVLMKKTPLITARVSWRSGTDYDVYALVLMQDGTAIDVAAFAAQDVPIRMEHAGVRHLGDVTASSAGEQEEIVEIRLTPDVLAVVPVAYSAITNGGGSFKEYKVSLEIDNGAGTRITVPAENANDDPGIYTCVPGMIRNSPDGVIVESLELYSRRGSEYRPIVRIEQGEPVVTMDKGAMNLVKPG